jgi:aspartokinase-like uncharacterized kinase
MCFLAMDQYAVMLADVLEDARLARGPGEVGTALEAGLLPILAPYRWLRREDPLPHDASVTSDSVSAWIARRLGAGKLVLVKSAPDRAGVDDYFEEAAAGLEREIVVPGADGWSRIA